MILYSVLALFVMNSSFASSNDLCNLLEKDISTAKQKITIYLAGSIQKGNEVSKEAFWTESDIDQLRSALNAFDVIILNPANRDNITSDQSSVFGRDMLYVFSSDIVFVDARNRRGLGVGAEMMWAKINKIPVIIWAPKNSPYNKGEMIVAGSGMNDFVHPFVNSLSDQIVETLTQGAEWIEQIISNPSCLEIKNIEHIYSAIHYYKTAHQKEDGSMKEVFQ